MPVGIAVDKAALDSIGQSVLQVRRALERFQKAKAWVDGKTDTEIKAITGYADADVALLRTALADLDNLRKVASGATVPPQATNFFASADRLTGIA